ncbi:TIGR03560 family F420-dependent LLM class oxidoreductase [Mycolicibacterium elephantis]|uniref:TIGR03560 family F420-dependent LLM class oxidoreductase n=1 Tax=Mycolicibacterium elephantis TaxID=81858 RepID=UPI0007EB8F9A|nr:TIGR03560 family F420-dependent LLM class oxidoreductase [Mycolicibacterium elephantis]OBA67767.1 LLM class F420-dependent oxidoreductase [Mycolicibacterium elephantis]
MKLSINVTRFDYPGGPEALRRSLIALAEAVDAAGLDTLWVGDHLLQADPFADVTDPMLEAYTTLGFLAAATHRLRLGTMVSAATYRAPALLIKAVTTLDALSGGRAWLGIGAGYQQREAAAMGLDLPPVSERFDRLEDTLRLANHMWAGDLTAFHGHYVHAEEPLSFPRPVSSPRPRILIGGTGPQRTLRLVAGYADAANFFDVPDGGIRLRTNLAVLAEHCATLDRDPDDIEHTATTALAPSEDASALADRCLALADLGIDHVVLIPRERPWLVGDADLLAATVAVIAS